MHTRFGQLVAYAFVLLLSVPSTSLSQEVNILPGVEKRKVVIVDGWTKDEVHQITVDFAKTYEHEIETIAELQVERFEDGPIVLSFPSELSAATFYYLINYFHYPYDINLDGRDITVLAIADVDSTFDVAVHGLTFFYVPVEDKEYDTIYAESLNGSTYQIPFYYELKWKPLSWKPFNWTSVDDPRQTDYIRELIEKVIEKHNRALSSQN